MIADIHARLPLRNGVKASHVRLPTIAGQYDKLLDFLCDHFSQVSAQQWRDRFICGTVLDQNGQKLSLDHPYVPGQLIFYYRQLANASEPRIPFQERILWLDEHLVVVDKPSFLPVIPSGQYLQETLLTRLRNSPQLANVDLANLTPIHRLDKDTAGVMLFSHNRQTRGLYQSLFQKHLIHKVYEAIAPTSSEYDFPIQVANRLERAKQFFLTEVVNGTPNAFTTIEHIEQWGEWSRYRLTPITGKKHQLRVHMMRLGLPIQNDGLYPVALPMDVVQFDLPLQLLAKSIAFVDPITSEKRIFTSSFQLPLDGFYSN